jgi:hypothetical protein
MMPLSVFTTPSPCSTSSHKRTPAAGSRLARVVRSMLLVCVCVCVCVCVVCVCVCVCLGLRAHDTPEQFSALVSAVSGVN